MMRNRKEWIVNGLLIAGIVALLVLTGLQRFRETGQERAATGPGQAGGAASPKEGGKTSETLRVTRESAYESTYAPVPASPPKTATATTSETVRVAESEFPNLGRRNIFRVLITPSPTPPPPTPTPEPTPSLDHATAKWGLQNSRRKAGKVIWVFSDGTNNIQIEDNGEPYAAIDDGRPLPITAQGIDRYSVLLKSGDQQKKFSMIQ